MLQLKKYREFFRSQGQYRPLKHFQPVSSPCVFNSTSFYVSQYENLKSYDKTGLFPISSKNYPNKNQKDIEILYNSHCSIFEWLWCFMPEGTIYVFKTYKVSR